MNNNFNTEVNIITNKVVSEVSPGNGFGITTACFINDEFILVSMHDVSDELANDLESEAKTYPSVKNQPATLKVELIEDGDLVYINDELGNSVCDLYHYKKNIDRFIPKEYHIENGKHIVRCVNMHGLLLDTIEELQNELNEVNGRMEGLEK